MIVAHLIGGNEIEGINEGIVFINDKQLEATYEELVGVCGNISLGDLDTSVHGGRGPEDILDDYIKLVQKYDSEIEDDFIINNHLTKEICYSHYEIDFEKKTLVLKIQTFE